MRLILGALAGTVIVFIVSACLHMFGPLGTMGMASMANEDAFMEQLRAAAPRSAVYMVPGMDMTKKPTEAEQKAWAEKAARGPFAMVFVSTAGTEAMGPRQLGLEFLTVLLAALVAAYIISMSAARYLGRALTVALLALFTFLSVGVSHWIWYRFPTEFVVAELLMELIAWVLGGLAMAAIIKGRAAAVVV